MGFHFGFLGAESSFWLDSAGATGWLVSVSSSADVVVVSDLAVVWLVRLGGSHQVSVGDSSFAWSWPGWLGGPSHRSSSQCLS